MKRIGAALQALSKATLDGNQRRLVRLCAWSIALALGLLQVAAHYQELSSTDGVSYLDIADTIFREDLKSSVNRSWSPLYSWLLGAAIYFLRPSAYWEFPVVNLIGFCLFVFMLLSFEFFLQRLMHEYRQKMIKEDETGKFMIVPEAIWMIAGYSIFLWASIHWIRVSSTTPDMLASSFIFLAAGLLIGINNRDAKWYDFPLLGVVLGFGYLTKAPLFALSFVFFFAALFASRDLRQSLPGVLLAFMVFSFIVAPFVIALSLQKGHFTVGDKGKLSYALYVNPGRKIIRGQHWQGGPPGFGHPVHPTRKILDDPLIFEFATPINGTYPPWYDPSYWNDGLKIRLDLKRQATMFARNLFFCWQEFLSILVFGYLLLIGASGNVRASLKQLLKGWNLWVIAFAGIGVSLVLSDLFALVLKNQPVTRHLAPYVILLSAALFRSLRLKQAHESIRLVGFTFGLAAFVVLITLFYRGAQDFVAFVTRKPPVHWQVADGLRNMGIQPGDEVVIIGDKVHVPWARLAKVRIIGQAQDVEEFWSVERSKRDLAVELLRRTGAKAFVSFPSRKKPDGDPGWQKIPGTSYIVLH